MEEQGSHIKYKAEKSLTKLIKKNLLIKCLIFILKKYRAKMI